VRGACGNRAGLLFLVIMLAAYHKLQALTK
jgi:hypothetical protein